MSAIGEHLLGNQNIWETRPGWTVRSRFLLKALLFCLFETTFYFGYRYGMSFGHACASPFWFPDSVLLCALLLAPPRVWWLLVLGPLPIRLLVEVPPGVPLWFLLIAFIIDSAKGIVGAVIMRRISHSAIRIQTAREFAVFCLLVVTLIPAVAAFGGAGARYLIGHEYWPAWSQWFWGDALAQLIVTPAILYWIFGRAWKGPFPSRWRWIEGVVLAVALLVASHNAFDTKSVRFGFAESWFYAPVPLLFWAALRFGVPGASGAIAVVAFFAITAALGRRGIFFGQSPADTAITLQHFLLLRVVPLYVVAILVDQRREVERSRRESEERFRNMANTAPVMLWMSGTDKLCEFFNKGWLDFTGRTMAEESGNGWAQGVHRDDLQHCLEVYLKSFDARIDFEMEYRLRRYDGEYRWILDRGSPRYAANGDFLGYIGSAIDITDRKRADEADRHLAHTMRLAAAGQLTAMVAHEITQPLAAILSNADSGELLLDSDSPPLEEIREIFDDIRRDNLRAHEAIRRIRSLMCKRDVQMAPFDLNETISDVIRLAAGDAARRHVRIWRGFSPDLPPAFGDRASLQQVLLNLLLNGMEAMKDTPVAERRLTVQTMMHNQSILEVAVADCGCGIEPERVPHIFESFFTTKADGMGLGLSIARSIIETHRGRIWAENNATQGATFHFTVRAADFSELQPAPAVRSHRG